MTELVAQACRNSFWTSLSTTEVRQDLASLFNRAAYGKERMVVCRRGKPVVAMIPVEDLALLEALEDHVDLVAARSALADPANRKAIPWEEAKAALGL